MRLPSASGDARNPSRVVAADSSPPSSGRDTVPLRGSTFMPEALACKGGCPPPDRLTVRLYHPSPAPSRWERRRPACLVHVFQTCRRDACAPRIRPLLTGRPAVPRRIRVPLTLESIGMGKALTPILAARRRRIRQGGSLALASGLLLGGAAAAKNDGKYAPPRDRLAARIASVLPTAAEERWLQVPWRTDLTRARLEAQRSGKPLFLWIMEGHPLGCT